MNTLQQRFGQVIRRRRLELELGQEALADKATLHRTHVSMIERGLRMPTLGVIKKLADALETSMAALMADLESSVVPSGSPKETRPPGRRPKQDRPKKTI